MKLIENAVVKIYSLFFSKQQNYEKCIALPPKNNMSTFVSKYVDNLDKMLQT